MDDFCFVCIVVSNKPSTYIEAEARFLNLEEELKPQEEIPHIKDFGRYDIGYQDWYPRIKGYTYGLNATRWCAGRGLSFVGLVTQLNDCAHYVRWYIDNQEVSPLDCTSMFGMDVCPSHTQKAWDMWSGR